MSCLSNQRQIGTALTLYLQDYDSLFPQEHPSCANPAVGVTPQGDFDGSDETADFGSPFEKIMPYVARGNASNTASLTQQLFVCPDDSDPRGASLGVGCTGSAPFPGVTSYLINAYFLFGMSESALQVPANTIYIAERNPDFCDVHVHPWLGEVYDSAGKAGAVEGKTPDNNPYVSTDGQFAVASERHTNGANYGFADGHVKWETYAATIKTNADQLYFGQYQALPDRPRAVP